MTRDQAISTRTYELFLAWMEDHLRAGKEPDTQEVGEQWQACFYMALGENRLEDGVTL